MSTPRIQGDGFKNGGFAAILIDGKRYTPEQIAQRVNGFDTLVAALSRINAAAHYGGNPENGMRRMPPELRAAIVAAPHYEVES